MPAANRSPAERVPAVTASRRGSGLSGLGVPVTVGLVMLACCAGPALLAAGALVAIGGILGSPWAFAAAGLLVLFAAVNVARRACFVRALTRPKRPGPPGR